MIGTVAEQLCQRGTKESHKQEFRPDSRPGSRSRAHLRNRLEQGPAVRRADRPPIPPPPAEQFPAKPLWGRLGAVKNGEVHEVSFGLRSTGRGTRSLGLVLDEAMPLLYPNVFGFLLFLGIASASISLIL